MSPIVGTRGTTARELATRPIAIRRQPYTGANQPLRLAISSAMAAIDRASVSTRMSSTAPESMRLASSAARRRCRSRPMPRSRCRMRAVARSRTTQMSAPGRRGRNSTQFGARFDDVHQDQPLRPHSVEIGPDGGEILHRRCDSERIAGASVAAASVTDTRSTSGAWLAEHSSRMAHV
jgi:hypothetical protein